MGDLTTDVQALKDASNAVVMAVETVVVDVEAQPTPTSEDPAWTAVKAALSSNGWTAPLAPAPMEPAPSTAVTDGTVTTVDGSSGDGTLAV